MRSVLSPLLQELYSHDDAYAVTAELLRTLGEDVILLSKLTCGIHKLCKTSQTRHLLHNPAVALGRDHAAIVRLLADEGIFYVVAVMVLYPPTSEITMASLGQLAAYDGQASWEAQVNMRTYHMPVGVNVVQLPCILL